MNERIVYFEGAFCPESYAKISIRTHAFLYGTSVFEGIRAYWNADHGSLYMFRALEHYQRLATSAKILRMTMPMAPEELVSLTADLIRQNADSQDIYIRPTLYKSDLKIGPGLVGVNDQLSIFTVPMGDYIDTSRPISVCTSSWRRIDDSAIPARAKVSGSYVNTALAKSSATLAGFDDTIMLDDRGHVCEGSAMNIFLVRDGMLITSPITNNILEGITRHTVLEMAAHLGIPTSQREIDRTELYVAEEAFFCGTGAQISSIGSIDHYTVGTGQLGSITAHIQQLYYQIVRGELAGYHHWAVRV